MGGAFPKELGQNLMSTEVDIRKTEKQKYRYLLAKKSSESIALRACGRQICFDSRKPSNLKKLVGQN